MSRVSLAIDVGAARIGVARCDGGRVLALPVETVRVDRYDSHLDRILDLIEEWEAADIYVGLPLLMSGQEGRAAHMARRFARRLRAMSGRPVFLVDERLTTVQAHAALHEAGRAGRTHRSVVDQASAVVLLDHVLDTERRTGEPVGLPVN
ncbi:MAG: Holliday junction resolvase RuvX [Bowdeniella nasicola]|nr:Holliday junction resolvase RuvX [Bowdeniella nasicola]